MENLTKKRILNFLKNAQIILKMYGYCIKNRFYKKILRQNVVKKRNFIYHNN